MLARRTFLQRAGLASAALAIPRLAFARAATERRFVFIIQRGAADGLATVIPSGDAAYAGLRGALAEQVTPLPLDAQFGLHPALATTHALYKRGEALFVHAVASPYRERSHFDGQNVLETGGRAPYQVASGWLNRLAAMLPGHDDMTAMAFAPTLPVALRGPLQVSSVAPSALPTASDDLLIRVGKLYAGDVQLHGLWDSALAAKGLADGSGPRGDPASIGTLAGTTLARAEGPRLAMIETQGWDTHSGQVGRLANQLKGIDAMVDAMRTALGASWRDTTVFVATEFGRTAAANGTGGTDHGTGSAAMVLGGAVAGGRVIADWPGLSPTALFEGRDLRPTTPLDALIAGTVAGALRLDPMLVQRSLFAGADRAPVAGLVRA